MCQALNTFLLNTNMKSQEFTENVIPFNKQERTATKRARRDIDDPRIEIPRRGTLRLSQIKQEIIRRTAQLADQAKDENFSFVNTALHTGILSDYAKAVLRHEQSSE